MIAKNIANKTYKAVYVPDDEDVEIKDFVRLRKNACKARGVIKKQINAFVLRHGFNYQRSKPIFEEIGAIVLVEMMTNLT